MSFDEGRLSELQGALRTKMADNKAIADSFKFEDGVMQVSTEQKAAFDRNMSDIKEIKGLIEGLEAMRDVDRWGSEAAAESVAAKSAAEAAGASHNPVRGKSIGEIFTGSAEFKALDGGPTVPTCPRPSS